MYRKINEGNKVIAKNFTHEELACKFLLVSESIFALELLAIIVVVII